MEEDGSLRIVFFPWLAFGHMLPFLELSKSLAKRGHRISFLSTRRNLKRLPKIPHDLAPFIHFVYLPLPKVEGLRAAAESTTDVLPDEVQFLKKAFDGLDIPFSEFLEEASPKPDWIIHDFGHHWLPPIASKFNIPCAFLCIVPASFIAFIGPPSEMKDSSRRTAEQFTKPPQWISFPSSVAYRLHEARLIVESFKANASGIADIRRFCLTVEGCNFIAFRSCFEFESDWLRLLEELYEKPVIPVGLLPPQVQEGSDDVHGNARIFEWLDKQAPNTVAYAALGSEAMLSVELLHELALGLELSKVPFLWALRKPASMAGDDADILPEGFLERTGGQGIVAMGWIPQIKVLAHASVGGFLTHSGWGSIIEGLRFGHGLVLLPISVDQGLNARIMEEKKIGLEIQRNEEDGSFNRESVAKAIRLVMVEEEGELFRCKAMELQRLFADRDSQERYVEDFILHLRYHRG
ncbi:putative UDP-rhamnose:rhamnosyltransferase 1 [Phoenix dactylifera]|uniref:UDP-rhamnose:rhamnosyltransferase 1 n=1 Tax=Phoenix dactylifera TaxID=42345 RepID=A0A8B7C081_PHODC|nr:putative UDP-rhamnose:rhamnosyltransferase 1 [Phoenix dactylifera]